MAGRTVNGQECSPCRSRRLRAYLDCPRCGQPSRPSVADPAICERCAGEPVRHVCRRCGATEENFAAGCCARCVLTERLDAVVAAGDPAAAARLAPYLDALRDGEKPWSVLNWMTVSAGFQTVKELVEGRLELSHEALDSVERGQSTTYLRAALVRAGVLPARHEQAVKLDRYIRQQLDRMPEGEDRTHLRTFATWQVHHDLERRERRGEAKRFSDKLARTKISVAIELILWLHGQQLALRDLRQEHLDTWLADGTTTRRRIRAFLTWARRNQLVPVLDAPWPQDHFTGDVLPDPERLRIVGRLLAEDTVDLRDRAAGCLLLIFAQPPARLTRLTVDHVDATRTPVTLRLGSEPLELAEPLGTLVAELTRCRPRLATTACDDNDRWLFPGLRLDAAMHPEHLRRRLAKLGLSSRASRAAALLHLAQQLPPAILADLLGISEGSAADWSEAAQGDWARYAADAASRSGSRR